jgi:hypothetical protein
VIAHHTRGTDCGYNGWDLTIVDGHLESRMYRVWPGNAIGVRTVVELQNEFQKTMLSSFGVDLDDPLMSRMDVGLPGLSVPPPHFSRPAISAVD